MALATVFLQCPGCSEPDEQSPDEKQKQALDAAAQPLDSEPAELPTFEPTQHSVVVSPGLYDTTERWHERFGVNGKLHIENGRRDDRLSYADGPIQLSFDATPMHPGVYTFVFALIHHDGLPSQLHAIHLYVVDEYENETPLTITPGQHYSRRQATVSPGQAVKVYWVPGGGLGPPGMPVGWQLSEVVYTNPTEDFHSPGIPRYEYIGGE